MRKLSVLVIPVLGAGLGLLGCQNPAASAAPAPPAAAPAPAALAAPAPRAADAKPAGPHAEGQGFVVDVKPPADAQVGASSKAQVVLRPTAGYHVNKEFPIVLAVTGPAGVDLPKPRQAGADAAKLADGEAIFDIPFTAKEAGDKAFAATFRFAVCTPTTCDPKNEKLAWSVTVK